MNQSEVELVWLTSVWHASWLTDRPFINVKKSYLYHKELDVFEVEPHDPDLQHHHWYVRTVVYIGRQGINEEKIWLHLTAMIIISCISMVNSWLRGQRRVMRIIIILII